MKTVISEFGICRMLVYKKFANQNSWSTCMEHIRTAAVNAKQSGRNVACVILFVNQREPSQARTEHGLQLVAGSTRDALVKEVTLQKSSPTNQWWVHF